MSANGAPERLVFTNIAVDKGTVPILEGRTYVTFAERGSRTDMTLQTRAIGLAANACLMIMGMGAGWSRSIDRLADLVAREALSKVP